MAKNPITGELKCKLERKAPRRDIQRTCKEPLQTGLKAVDTMIPIGRRTKKLIIETAKLVKPLSNWYHHRKSFTKPVTCVLYICSHRSKSSTIANDERFWKIMALWLILLLLQLHIGPSFPLQFYAPFFRGSYRRIYRDTGRPALIIYDDLSKQAVAYREVSLLLRRPPGAKPIKAMCFTCTAVYWKRAAKIIDSDEVAKKWMICPKVSDI